MCSVEQVPTGKSGTIILSICSSMHVKMCIKLYVVVNALIIFSLFATVAIFLPLTHPECSNGEYVCNDISSIRYVLVSYNFHTY